MTFEDGLKLKENKRIKEYEDYTDEAFEKLCGSEAGTYILKAVREKEPFYQQSILSYLPQLHCYLSPLLSLSGAETWLLCFCPPPWGSCSLKLSPPFSLHSHCLLRQFHLLPHLQFLPAGSSTYSCWKAPWTSSTSISNSARAQSHF